MDREISERVGHRHYRLLADADLAGIKILRSTYEVS